MLNKNFYSNIATIYDNFKLDKSYYKKRILFINLLNKNFKKIKLLDIGCGVGYDLKFFSKHKCITYGIDSNEKMILYAKKRSPDSYIFNADFKSLKLNKKFNAIWCISLLQNISNINDIDIFLEKINMCTLKKSFVFISIPVFTNLKFNILHKIERKKINSVSLNSKELFFNHDYKIIISKFRFYNFYLLNQSNWKADNKKTHYEFIFQKY